MYFSQTLRSIEIHGDPPCRSMATQRRSTEIYGRRIYIFYEVSTEIHRDPRRSTEIHGDPRRSMEIHDDPWRKRSMGIFCGVSAEIHRGPWKSIYLWSLQGDPGRSVGHQKFHARLLHARTGLLFMVSMWGHGELTLYYGKIIK